MPLLVTVNPQLIPDFIAAEELPESYGEDAKKFFLPLGQELIERIARSDATVLIGINGAQGTGKSTLAKLLEGQFSAQGLRCAALSIDDFYLSRQQRLSLGAEVHPLLATRGVPGTHDTALLQQTLTALRQSGAADATALPRFDKASDDCVPRSQWPQLSGPIDVVLLEGWFVGASPEGGKELESALNALEQGEDPDGNWRRFVNDALARDYQGIWEALDLLIMLQAPTFEQVFAWRRLQEEKLRRRRANTGAGLMDDAQLERFVQHFERLTRHCLATLVADIVFPLGTDHRVRARLDSRGKAHSQA